MTEQYYEIQLKTPLGIKRGTMFVKIRHGELSGILDVMKHAEAFSGTIEEDGTCCFTGHMVTIMRIISYEAAGVIDDRCVDLSLKGERNIFHITGRACKNKNQL